MNGQLPAELGDCTKLCELFRVKSIIFFIVIWGRIMIGKITHKYMW